MKLAIQSLTGSASGDITLDKDIFGLPVRADLLNAYVKYQRANAQAGTHKTKTRSEVSATGKKAFKQKGTGNARTSTLDTPRHRGGGTAHGPVVRSHAIKMNKKVRALAFKTALSAKAADNKIIVLADAKAKSHKTKAMAEALSKMNISNAVIVTGKEIDSNFDRATNNIPCIDVFDVNGANVYDILRRDTLVLTKEAVEALTERLKGK
jgi:large subunit ribosomal protein L4